MANHYEDIFEDVTLITRTTIDQLIVRFGEEIEDCFERIIGEDGQERWIGNPKCISVKIMNSILLCPPDCPPWATQV